MRSQCGAIFQIGQIIYVDDGDGGLTVFGNRDRTVRVPGARNQLSKMGARFSQAIRIRHTAKCTLCRERLSWPPANALPPGRGDDRVGEEAEEQAEQAAPGRGLLE